MTLSDLALKRDEETGRWILMFDASLYKESDCLRKVWYRLLRGLRPIGKEGFYAAYGNAVHRAMKVLYSGGSLQQATEAAYNYYKDIPVPDSDWHNLAHLMNCVMQYHEHYKHEGELLKPITVDGKLLLEKNFAFPFYRTDKVEVLLCGTMDMISRFAGQQNILVDHKTRTLKKCTDYYAQQYLDGYVLSPQMMTYKYIYRKLFPGQDVDCLINGIFLDEKNKNIFKRSQVFTYSEEQMRNYERHLTNRVKEIVDNFEQVLETKDGDEISTFGLFPHNYTQCSQWCEYLPLDSLSEERDVEMIIGNSYEKKIYDPLVFQN